MSNSFHCPAEVIERVQVERRVFGDEFDVVVHTCMSDSFDNTGPGAMQVGANARLVSVQYLSQFVVPHV